MSRLQELIDAGFDKSTANGRKFGNPVSVACSQCQALVINGFPCHEAGCINERHECKGCDTTVERANTYCPDCQ